jgi:hypothetical protein
LAELKGRWSVRPQENGGFAARIIPAVRLGARKIETITFSEIVVFYLIEPDFTGSADDVNKFLAFVVIGTATSGTGRNAVKVGLHHVVPEGQKFDVDSGFVGKLLADARVYEFERLPGGPKKGLHVGPIKNG